MGPARPLLLVFALAASATLAALASDAPLPDDASLDGPPPGWPARIEVPEPPPLPAGHEPEIPEPTLTEPFEIGEALYDPARAEDAAISLLNLLGVAIGDGEGRFLRPAPIRGGAPFHFTVAETRGFLARAVASADAAAESGSPSLTFADLHRAVAPGLPGWSAERLAAAYAGAYEREPQDLAPLVMLGQPITPETPLLYPQLWLLLVDGFLPPAGTPRPGAVVPAQAPAGGPGWGTAARVVPIYAGAALYQRMRIASAIYANAPQIVPRRARAHEGHGGPGAPVHLEASFPAPPGPIVEPSTGHVAVHPRRPPDLSGVELAWRADRDRFERHGTLTLDSPRGGTAKLTFQPKSETARGRGRLMRETAQVYLRASLAELAEASYLMDPGLGAWLFEDAPVPSGTAIVDIEWHELETIDVTVVNVYDVKLPLGGFGTAKRKGRDTVAGTLAKSPDGNWYGVLRGTVRGHQQEVRAYGRSCPQAGVWYTQDLHVIGTPIDRFGPTHPSSAYRFGLNPDGTRRSPTDFPEKLSLEFVPASPPELRSGANRCWKPIPTPLSLDKFIPFNDAQWTIEHAGYGIALPEEGTLTYTEVGGAAAGGPPGSSPSNPAGDALGRLLTAANFGTSTWYVSVERHREAP